MAIDVDFSISSMIIDERKARVENKSLHHVIHIGDQTCII